MSIARSTIWIFSSSWPMRTCFRRRWMMAPKTTPVIVTLACLLLVGVLVSGQDSLKDRQTYVSNLSDEQKIELQRKKERFDDLSKEKQDKLRALHVSITTDPNAKELEETVKRYNQWLATLSSPQRTKLLDISNPQERIKSIKELMQMQEEQRFREFTS